MKKTMMVTAAVVAAAAVLNPLSAEAALADQVTVVYKGSENEWNTQSVEWQEITDCLKWGTILWKDGCPIQPEEKPEAGVPENKPETPESKPEKPENKPETPERPEKPENKPESKPEAPEKPEKPEVPEKPENKPENKTFAEQVVELVNLERGKEGLSALSVDERIAAAADMRAGEIQQSFSHTRPNGSSFSTALKEAGAVYNSAGENIAWGQKTPEEVVKAWMNSPGHRANIMNKNYSRIGVSHMKNAQGTSYWVQLFAN